MAISLSNGLGVHPGAISELPEPDRTQTPAGSGELIIPILGHKSERPYSRIRNVDETRSGGTDLPIEPV